MEFREELNKLKENGLRRNLVLTEKGNTPRIIIKGKELLNLSSNNYLNLASDVRLKEAAKKAVEDYGVGSGASRLISGNTFYHQKLEKKIAQFKKCEKALLFNSGYVANCGVISALVGKGDIIFSDELNHASLIDGTILSKADYKIYPHKDISSLEKLLKEGSNYRRKLLITDTVFSMDGDVAPLLEIVDLAQKYEVTILVDEAHATGVLGKNGRGAVDFFNLKNKIEIQMGTLSKAVGTFGAFVCGSPTLIDYLINRSRAFIYTTSLPPAICAATVKALEIIEEEPERRKTLWENVNFLKEGLQSMGFHILPTQSAIISILTCEVKTTMKFSQKLEERGIFARGIRPPTVPEGKSRIRLTTTSGHQKDELKYALKIFKEVGRKLKII